MEKYFENRGLVRLLVKWKYHIAVITIIAGVLAVIFSGPKFITSLYKSYAIVYPANISPYSEESETEQMLQIMQSRDIKDSVIKKFDLAKHYKIDSNYKYFYSTLLYEYNDHVSIKKTPYDAVEVEVYDKDPQRACDMVNSILNFYSKKVRRLQNEKWEEVIKIFQNQIAFKEKGIDSLKNVLYELGTKYGLYDYEGQSREITEGLLGTVEGAGRNQINVREVNKLNEAMKKKSGDLISTVELIKSEAEAFATVKLDYEQAIRFYSDILTHENRITSPFPADRKSYPIRWLVVVISAIAAFFLASLIILIIERYKSYLKTKQE